MVDAMHDLSPDTFERDGYLVVRGLFDRPGVEEMRATVRRALHPLQGPAEFETDVGYPGSPASRGAAGGHTPRRLLHAYSRGAGLSPVGDGRRNSARRCAASCARTISKCPSATTTAS